MIQIKEDSWADLGLNLRSLPINEQRSEGNRCGCSSLGGSLSHRPVDCTTGLVIYTAPTSTSADKSKEMIQYSTI